MRNLETHRRGAEHGNYKTGRFINSQGYVLIQNPDHPRCNNSGYVREHILVAEGALEKRLPHGAEVHHVDEDRANNAPGNLVICPDRAYHLLLHRRMRALKACGHANWRKCKFCKQYDDPVGMYVYGKAASHRDCHLAYNKQHGGRLP